MESQREVSVHLVFAVKYVLRHWYRYAVVLFLPSLG